MKFNIEVELDYIDEDGSLNEAIKESIMSSVTAIVMNKIEREVNAKLDEIVIKAAQKKASKIVNDITNDFITKEFTKIDRYGSKIETGLTVEKLLTRDFDDFWKAIVDKNGSKTDRYGETKTRIEWKIDEMIENHSRIFADRLTQDTANKIKKMMKDNLSQTIGAKLVNELGFDKMLLETNK